MYVKASSLSEPLPNSLVFGQFVGRCIHPGQNKPTTQAMNCTKCLGEGHKFSQCPNDWVCNICKVSGHKQSNCPNQSSHSDSESEVESEVEDTDPSNPTSATKPEEPPTKPSTTEPLVSMASTPNTGKPEKPRVSEESTKPERQIPMDRFVVKNNDTPKPTRTNNVTERSPPTPVDELHDRVTTSKRNKKGKHNK